MVGMERLAGSRFARAESMETAGTFDRYLVCWWTKDGYFLAAGSRNQYRLHRLLLLPLQRWTQYRIDCDAIGFADIANVATARTIAAGDRRLADPTIRAA